MEFCLLDTGVCEHGSGSDMVSIILFLGFGFLFQDRFEHLEQRFVTATTAKNKTDEKTQYLFKKQWRSLKKPLMCDQTVKNIE